MRSLHKAWPVVLVLVLALVLASCQPVATTGPVQVEVLNAADFAGVAGRALERGGLLCATESGNCVESWNGSDIVVYSDAGSTSTFSVDGATGNVTVGGTLGLTGATTLTSLTVNGNGTITGTLNVQGAVSDSGGDVTVNDNVVITGTLNVQGAVSDSGGDVTVNDNVDITGTLQYGASNLYPVGYASSGQQLVYGSTTITGTATAAHGLTTVTFCNATLGEDPETGAGDAFFVTVAVAGNACTLKAWQDDGSAATETDVVVQWVVVGAP